MREVFEGSGQNPLINANNLPYQANAVFSAGAADLGDEVALTLEEKIG